MYKIFIKSEIYKKKQENFLNQLLQAQERNGHT